MEKLAARIERACKTVAGELPKADQVYLFVLEDTELNKVVGVCGIEVALGLKRALVQFPCRNPSSRFRTLKCL